MNRLAAALVALTFLVLPGLASAATYTVDSTGNQADAASGNGVCLTSAGTCTLRAALTESNASPAVRDTIEFSAAFDGEIGDTIEQAFAPYILEPVHIDGDAGGRCDTDAGVPGPCVGLDDELTVWEADDVTIEGIAIAARSLWAIHVGLQSQEFSARNDWLGLDLAGEPAGSWLGGTTSGTWTGISIEPGSDGATIGGVDGADRNVFAGNREEGLLVRGASGTVIRGNYFGIAPDGATPLANGRDLVVTDSSVEGDAPATDNEIRGNVIGGGVDLQGEGPAQQFREAPATGPTAIRGNYIGLDATGAPLPASASDWGVRVGGAGEALIGGSAEDQNRIVAGQYGIYTDGASGLMVKDNEIGTEAEDEVVGPTVAAVFNRSSGVEVGSEIEGNSILAPGGVGIDQGFEAASIKGNTITGAVTGIRVSGPHEGLGSILEGNEIEEAQEDGVVLASDSNRVFGNSILGAGEAGVRIEGMGPGLSSSGNLVGGDTTASENEIAGSGDAAVKIVDLDRSINRVARNHGVDNGGLFIDLVSPDPVSQPLGPNQGLQPPSFTGTTPTGATGTGEPGALVRVFRKASADPGELEAFLGEATVDASGNWALSYGAPLPADTPVAASQTRLAGGTSELTLGTTSSAALAATAGAVGAPAALSAVSGSTAPRRAAKKATCRRKKARAQRLSRKCRQPARKARRHR